MAKVLAAAMAWVLVVSGARAELTPEMVRTGKKATALVEVTKAGARGFGSAFCIDSSGIFVTNAHVASGTLKLVLNPSEKDQQTVEATVLRTDKEADLALVKIPPQEGLKALELGSVDDLYDTMAVTAFGYPFGTGLAMEKGDYPTVSVNMGHITSLRKRQGVLELLQLDAVLNPGNSGGPVLDDKGRVVGIVQGGVRGAGVNFAIPVSRLQTLLSKPEIVLSPTTLPFARQSEEQEFTVKVIALARPTTRFAVQMTLTNGPTTRELVGQDEGDGKYTIKATPVPPRVGPRQLQLSVRYTGGSLVGRVGDVAVKVAGQAMKLGDIRRIDRADKTTVTLVGGKELAGSVEGLSAVVASFGEATATLDLTKAQSITVEELDRPSATVGYRVSVKLDGTLVAETMGSLEVIGAPAAALSPGTTSAMPVSIGVAPLEQEMVSRKLPGTVENVIAAGGGRYLILHLKKLRKLAIFDVSEAKVTQFITLGADDVFYAAGMDKLVMVLPEQSIVQRWSLKTFEKELTIPLPDADRVQSVAMGYASGGPVLLAAASPIFLDVATLKPLNVQFEAEGSWRSYWHSGLLTRASGDGSTFAAWARNTSPSGIRLLTLNGDRVAGRYAHESGGYLIPSFDGSILYTGTGMYSSDLKAIRSDEFRQVQCFPSYDPSYFVGFHPGVDRSGVGSGAARAKLSIYTASDRRLLITLDDLPELSPEARGSGSFGPPVLSYEQRIHLFPSANLLVTIPAARDELVLRRMAVTEALDKAGIDYLFVASMPSREARAGEAYTYALAVKSKRGGVKYNLDSGPEGMTCSADGKLKWNVPADQKAATVGVIVSVRDASGQEVYHSFTLNVHP